MPRQLPAEVVASRTFQRWFRAWWEQDYSTIGCQTKGISVARPHRNQIISFAGRDWYSSHCPPFDLDGNECLDFHSIAPVVLDETRHTAQPGVIRFSYQGAFIDQIRTSSPSSIEVDVSNAMLLGPVSLSGSSSRIRFVGNKAYVCDGLRLHSPSRLEVELQGTIVAGAVDLATDRDGSVDLTGSKLLAATTIHGMFNQILARRIVSRSTFDLSRLTRVNTLVLDGSRLSGPLELHALGSRALESIRLAKARFFGGLSLANVNAPNGIDLSHSDVRGVLDVKSSQASWIDGTHLKFGNGRFIEINGDLRLNNLSAGSIAIDRSSIGEFSMESGIVTGAMIVNSTTFVSRSLLHSAKIGNRLIFRDCDFRLGVFAKALEVTASANFRGTSFGKNNSFRSARFLDGVDFNARSDLDESPRPPVNEIGSVDFRNCLFGVRKAVVAADFSGRTFKGKADFQHARFNGAAYFEREAFSEDVSFRLATFSHPRLAWPFRLSGRWPFIVKDEATSLLNANEAAHSFERAFSNLKDCMRSAGSGRFEKKFHIYELRARRARWDAEVGITERLFSFLYDVFSEYGESIKRPLAWLFATPLVCAVIYYEISGQSDSRFAFLSLDFSLQQVFRPFFVWSNSLRGGDSSVGGVLFALTNSTRDDSVGLLVKSIASLEALVALTLSFLLALAIKRRFQVQYGCGDCAVTQAPLEPPRLRRRPGGLHQRHAERPRPE